MLSHHISNEDTGPQEEQQIELSSETKKSIILKLPKQANLIVETPSFQNKDLNLYFQHVTFSIDDDDQDAGLRLVINGNIRDIKDFIRKRLVAINNQFSYHTLQQPQYNLKMEAEDLSFTGRYFHSIVIKGFRKESLFGASQDVIFEITKNRVEFFVNLFPYGETITLEELTKNIKKYEDKISEIEKKSLKEYTLSDALLIPDYIVAEYYTGKKLFDDSLDLAREPQNTSSTQTTVAVSQSQKMKSVSLEAPKVISLALIQILDCHDANFYSSLNQLAFCISDDKKNIGLRIMINGNGNSLETYFTNRLRAINQRFQFLMHPQLPKYHLKIKRTDLAKCDTNYFGLDITGFKREFLTSKISETILFEITKNRFDFFVTILSQGRIISKEELIEAIKKYEDKILEIESDSVSDFLFSEDLAKPDRVETQYYTGQALFGDGSVLIATPVRMKRRLGDNPDPKKPKTSIEPVETTSTTTTTTTTSASANIQQPIAKKSITLQAPRPISIASLDKCPVFKRNDPNSFVKNIAFSIDDDDENCRLLLVIKENGSIFKNYLQGRLQTINNKLGGEDFKFKKYFFEISFSNRFPMLYLWIKGFRKEEFNDNLSEEMIFKITQNRVEFIMGLVPVKLSLSSMELMKRIKKYEDKIAELEMESTQQSTSLVSVSSVLTAKYFKGEQLLVTVPNPLNVDASGHSLMPNTFRPSNSFAIMFATSQPLNSSVYPNAVIPQNNIEQETRIQSNQCNNNAPTPTNTN